MGDAQAQETTGRETRRGLTGLQRSSDYEITVGLLEDNIPGLATKHVYLKLQLF